ncbi:MAG: four helix bundle protein [Planctomycetaceae bacterium]
MKNDVPSPGVSSGNTQKKYDLDDRTTRFAEAIIEFAKRIPPTPVADPLVRQLVRSGTSIGANYCEADDAGSKKEFRYRIRICKREARETKYWLRMMAKAVPEMRDEARTHWREAKELHLIFASIYRGKPKPDTNRST